MRRALPLAAGLLLALAAPALAVGESELADLGSGTPSTTTVPGSGAGDIGRLLLGLVIVVLVIGALYAILKRVQHGRLPGGRAGRGDGSVEVMSTTPLGPGRNLHLVRVGDRVLLLGASEHSVSLLQAYDHESAAAEGLVELELDPPAVAEVHELDVPRTFVDALRERTLR
jgi:flagellar protein FliO/FliZ